MEAHITRRTFLGGAALTAAGCLIPAGKRPDTTYVTIDLDLPEGAKPLTLRRIEAGEFMMGCGLDAFYRIGREWPSHKVVITRPFYMGIFEVTQAQWESVMGENPATEKGIGDNFPVHGINMDKTREFLKRLGQRGRKFRLPTEAEWEYACKAGSNTRFCFGDAEKYDSGAQSCPELDKYAWWRWDQEERPDGPQEVGQKLPNDWGLHDMHGNLWELCEDYLIRGKPKLEETIRYDPLETTVTKEFLIKGGSHDTAIFHMHLADRTGGKIAQKNYGVLCGLRVVMEVPKLPH